MNTLLSFCLRYKASMETRVLPTGDIAIQVRIPDKNIAYKKVFPRRDIDYSEFFEQRIVEQLKMQMDRFEEGVQRLKS